MSERSGSTDEDNQFYYEEFKEACAHYRHLEEERSRHLRFFLLLAGALVGLFGYLGTSGRRSIICSDWVFIGGLIMVLLQILDTLTFVTVRRLENARLQHEEVKKYVRCKLSGGDGRIIEMWKDFRDSGGVSVQCTIEFTLHLFAVVLFQAALFFFAAHTQTFWRGLLVLAFTNSLFFIHIMVLVRLSCQKEEQSSKCMKHGLE